MKEVIGDEKMKKNFIITILISIIIILSGVCFYLYNSTKVETRDKTVLKNKSNKSKDSNIITNDDLEINKSEVTTENDLVNYLGDVEKEVDTTTDKKTLKNTFITLTDFIFYDGEIKGKKFSDLTDSAKTKVIDLYEKIDSKIEAKYPNYKENIKETSGKVYNNAKEKAVELKNSILNKYKESVGEDGYNETQEAYESDKKNLTNVYDTYKPYIEKGKEKAKSNYEKAKEKVSSWYQEYKESSD